MRKAFFPAIRTSIKIIEPSIWYHSNTPQPTDIHYSDLLCDCSAVMTRFMWLWCYGRGPKKCLGQRCDDRVFLDSGLDLHLWRREWFDSWHCVLADIHELEVESLECVSCGHKICTLSYIHWFWRLLPAYLAACHIMMTVRRTAARPKAMFVVMSGVIVECWAIFWGLTQMDW